MGISKTNNQERFEVGSLLTITDHLEALNVANATLARIESQLTKASDKASDWYIRATTAHKTWHWFRTQICGQLSVLRQKEKERNINLHISKDQFLIQALRQRVTAEEFEQCVLIANEKATSGLSEFIQDNNED
ncbi:hypothetical protein [Yersinia thracica]|uniref:hypothetical protein n=1 Tax=Yersinia thracica TaxID=2890319 RepID=UPI00157D002E|nr:hypothetical protein [Yersinia thracica]